MNLRIKITLETERLMILHKYVRRRIRCAECEAETDFVREEDAYKLLLKLKKDFPTENLHKFQTIEGSKLICLESLLRNLS